MNNTVLKVTAMKTTYIYLNMLSLHIRIKGPNTQMKLVSSKLTLSYLWSWRKYENDPEYDFLRKIMRLVSVGL